MRSFVRQWVWVVLLAAAVSSCAHGRKKFERHSTITDAPLQFVFFDLGQADAMLVVYGGHTLLMDAGESRYEPDQQKFHDITEALQTMTSGKHLDHFVVSHYHQDHVGGPKDTTGLWGLFADGVTIGTMNDRGGDIFGNDGKGETQKAYEKALPQWLSSGKASAHRVLRIGDLLELGEGLKVEVVAANGNQVLSQVNPTELDVWPASENDYSVALKFTYGDFELFAGGDLTGLTDHREFGNRKEGYHDVESSTAERVGDVEVYRVDHHGSAHSSNPCFLNVLRPEVSIISSGENNYGHPSPKVYAALDEFGKVFITGGADKKVRNKVEKAIVGGPITINVERGGKRYAVNNRDFKAKSDEQEAQIPGHLEQCLEPSSFRQAR